MFGDLELNLNYTYQAFKLSDNLQDYQALLQTLSHDVNRFIIAELLAKNKARDPAYTAASFGPIMQAILIILYVNGMCLDNIIQVLKNRNNTLHSDVLDALTVLIATRLAQRPAGSYITALLASGPDRVLQKIGEECTELMIAACNQNKTDIANETADFLFHSMVYLGSIGTSLAAVRASRAI